MVRMQLLTSVPAKCRKAGAGHVDTAPHFCLILATNKHNLSDCQRLCIIPHVTFDRMSTAIFSGNGDE
jgi:hypothetical protein